MKISDLGLEGTQKGFDFDFSIKQIFKVVEGDGEYGHYSFQNLILSDGFLQIACVLKNQEVLTKEDIGKVLSVKCKEYNGNMIGTGLEYVKSKDGKIAPRIIVNKSASVSLSQSSNSPAKQTETVTQSEEEIFVKKLEQAYEQAFKFLTNPKIVDLCAALKLVGWSSEDLRALAFTFMKETTRK